MKYGLLFSLLLLLGCNRPANRAAAAPPPTYTRPDVATPAYQPDDLAIDKASATAPPEATERAPLPDIEELKERRRREVRERRDKMGETRDPAQLTERDNRTAQKENQANLGTASIFKEVEDRRRNAYEDSLLVKTILVFAKTSCYGDCSVYTFTLDSGRDAKLDVKKGLDGPGDYADRLDLMDYGSLTEQIDSLREVEFAELYPTDEPPPTDAPARRIGLPGPDGKLRRIKVYYGAPEALTRLLDEVEALVEEKRWTKKN